MQIGKVLQRPVQKPVQKTPLTKNGNEYKPCRLGTTAGALAGSLGGAALVQGFAVKTMAEGLEHSLKSTGVKGLAKGFAKSGIAGLAIGAAVGLGTAAGALVGNLLDAPMNQELRDQADGEAALKAKKISVEA